MNGDRLVDALRAAIDAAVTAHPGADADQRRAIWRGIGAAIVAEITANASVAVNVASVAGVQPGAGVSGAGTGTGSIT